MNNNIIMNQLLDKVEPSKSVTLLGKVNAMQEKIPDILNLTGGEPDFDTPRPIIEEAYQQMLAGYTHYVNSKGDLELREAISEKLETENNIHFSPKQILVTPGAKYAIYVAIQALVNPGDEVIWLAPGWVSYPAIVTLCGGTPVKVELSYKSHYAVTAEQLEEKTTEKTKMIIINYPNNPTGATLTKSDLAEIKSYLRAHPNVYCLTDEIYEKLIYGDSKFRSPASDPEFADRCLVVNGFSKSSAMTGWRIGYLACNEQIYRGALKIFQHSMSNTNSFSQKAAIVALNHPEETERMRKAYARRQRLVYEGLNDIPNVEFRKPHGAFYAWVRFFTDKTSEEVCDLLLEKAHIGGIPGSAYGVTKECMVRFCVAKDDETLISFVKRMEKFCKEEL